MKNVLGIIGSPRKLGNCELLVKEIAAHVPGGATLSMVRLVEKDIQPCKACYRCLSGECPHQDGFRSVMEAILSADGVIVAAPAYSRGTHSSLQRFLDRGLQFIKHVNTLERKAAVAVAVAGVKDGQGSALLGVENFIRSMGMRVKDRALIYAALPGEALLSEEGKAAAHRLAGSLFGTPVLPTSPHCSVCGGSYFEFQDRSRLYCLLCGERGVVSIDGVETRINTKPPAHAWLDAGAFGAHGRWLMGMKEKFLREREKLKAVTSPYRGGTFL
jgi:multimeric flavodoxin WrbA